MLLLIVLNLFNAVANELEVIIRLRLPIPGFPLGILECFAVALLIYAFVFGGKSAFPSRRMHPALVTTLVLLVLALIIGSIADFLAEVSLDTYLRWLRELGAWPLY